MKLLLLYEHPIAGATWINLNYLGYKLISNYKLYPCSLQRFEFLVKEGQYIGINSGRKIRFGKPYQNLQILKGLNEF